MATPTSPAPQALRVRQRLLRGYGPLAVFAALLVLMALLVPTKSPQVVSSAVDDSLVPPADGGVTSGATTGTSGGTVPGAASATTGAGGTTSGGGPSPGRATGTASACQGRTQQVPGDPYSPPCVEFTGDNGGNTSRGVTKDEVVLSFRVLNERGFQQTLAALAGATLQDTPADIRRTVSTLAEFFNQRYQFYGRKIAVKFYDGKGSNTSELLGRGQEKAEADADQVKALGAFADLSSTSEPYADALTRRGILAFGDPYMSRPWHVRHRPYAWSLATDGTVVALRAAEYAAKRLCNKPAKWAGGDLATKKRVIATFAPENSWYQESVQISRQRSRELGCEPGPNIAYQLDLGTMSNQSANLIPKMKAEGVTTILCGCDPIMPVFLTAEMNRARFYPEFIIVGTALTDTDIVGQLWNQEAAKHVLGVSALAEPVPPTQTIAYEAYKTIRQDEPAFSVDIIYYQMQMLALGIQLAGPNLTPATFEQGMFRFQPRLGPVGFWQFGEGDYTPPNDVREIYWDPNATSKYNGKKGAYIEPSPGVRWKENEIPAGEPQIPVR